MLVWCNSDIFRHNCSTLILEQSSVYSSHKYNYTNHQLELLLVCLLLIKLFFNNSVFEENAAWLSLTEIAPDCYFLSPVATLSKEVIVLGWQAKILHTFIIIRPGVSSSFWVQNLENVVALV